MSSCKFSQWIFIFVTWICCEDVFQITGIEGGQGTFTLSLTLLSKTIPTEDTRKELYFSPKLRIGAIYEGIWGGYLNWSTFWNRWSHLYKKACCCRVKCIMSIFRFLFSIMGFWAIAWNVQLLSEGPKLIEKNRHLMDVFFSSFCVQGR